ncbi:MAG: DUF6626 family protein [Usitatibacteraceae bacterium]
MSYLTEIYEVLRAEGFCETQAEFSRVWLGRSHHYLAQIKNDPSRASITSLRLLATRLELAWLLATKTAPYETQRKLRAAFVSARTLCCGEFELRHVPRWYHVTAWAA